MSLPKTPLTDFDMMLKDKAAFLIEMFLTYIIDPKNDSHFSLVMKWFGEEGIISDKDIALKFSVTRSVARDWISGFDCPDPDLHPVVIKWLIEKSNKFFKEQNRQ